MTQILTREELKEEYQRRGVCIVNQNEEQEQEGLNNYKENNMDAVELEEQGYDEDYYIDYADYNYEQMKGEEQ